MFRVLVAVLHLNLVAGKLRFTCPHEISFEVLLRVACVLRLT
jgi:hypothetical protein